MTTRYYVERSKSTNHHQPWDFELRDRLMGANSDPIAWLTDVLLAEKIAEMLNTAIVPVAKSAEVRSPRQRRVLEHV